MTPGELPDLVCLYGMNLIEGVFGFEFRQKRQVQTWGGSSECVGSDKAEECDGSCFDLNILALLNSILKKNTV